jgi:putative ABC transport system substrate-binding protein
MRRREFITLLGGAAAAWPLAARAQQPTMPLIGHLALGPSFPAFDLAFKQGLGQIGYVEGQNVLIEHRYGEPHELPALASELVKQRVAVIAALNSPLPALAAKAATTSIPIVFRYGGDPVADGLVTSLNHPGGNVTGITGLSTELTGKRFELLHEMVPSAKSIGFLLGPASTAAAARVRGEAAEYASGSFGTHLEFLTATKVGEIDAAFAIVKQQGVEALVIQNHPFLFQQFSRLVALATRYEVPAIYPAREAVDTGGLMSYGPSFADDFRLAGVYVGRILKGDIPANLPVVQPTKFELVINLKVAKALGLTIPLTLQYAADEVIEQ